MRWNRKLVLGCMLVATAVTPDSGRAGEPEEPQRCVVRIGTPTAGRHLASFEDVDHAAFDELLHRFVDCRGMVCYRAWKVDTDAVARLHAYLVGLGHVDVRHPSASSARMAFYINAYNALTLWGILQEYPTPSIQTHNRGKDYQIFDDLQLCVDGEYLSLNRIEHEVLRPLKEPRIHFALVCAAKGCPRLRNEAYVAARLEEQLNDNATDFFASRERFHVCRLTGKVKLSPLLKWYGKDFGEGKEAVLAAVLPYLPCKDREWLLAHPCWKVEYLGYDWGLNDRCPTVCVRLMGRAYAVFARVEPAVRPLLDHFGVKK